MTEEEKKVLIQILQRQERIEQILILYAPTLKTKKEVAAFFNVSDRTIDNWKDNGKFEKGVEYFIDDNGKTEYILEGILNHNQKIMNKKNAIQQNEEFEKTYHPSIKNIVKGLKGVKIG